VASAHRHVGRRRRRAGAERRGEERRGEERRGEARRGDYLSSRRLPLLRDYLSETTSPSYAYRTLGEVVSEVTWGNLG